MAASDFTGVTTPIITATPVSDDVLVNRGGNTRRQSTTDLATQLAGNGAIADKLAALANNQVTGGISAASWAELAAVAGTAAKQGAQVLDADTGTHTDPVVGGTVANGGSYQWSVSPAGWKRIGNTGLAGKVDKTQPLGNTGLAQVTGTLGNNPVVGVPAAGATKAVAGTATDAAMTPADTKAAMDSRVGPGGSLIETSVDYYYQGKKLIAWIPDPNSRMLMGISEDGFQYSKFAIGIGAAANGLTWSQDSAGFWRIGFGSADGIMPLTSGGDTIDTRYTRFYDGKRVVYEIKFSGDQVAFVVTEDGMVYLPKTNVAVDLTAVNASIAALSSSVALLRPSQEFAFYGDSLTASDMPSSFAALSGRATYNRGIGGQVSNQIAQRQGGNVALVTISGNQIASGANTITAFNGVAIATMAANPSADQLLSTASDNNTRSVKFVIAGVTGTLTRTASGGPPSTLEGYSFTADAGQTLPVTCPPLTPMLIDTSGDDKRTNVFWPGRNNDWTSPAQILSDIAAMASRLATAEKRYIVMSVLNGEYPTEYAGGSRYIQLTAINAAIAKAHPKNFLDIRRYLIDHGLADAGITPTSQDLIDISHDIVPLSLRQDNIHINNFARPLVAAQVNNFRIQKGW